MPTKEGDYMVVFATLDSARADETGKALYTGSLEECRRYTAAMKYKELYCSINICEDNGIIRERVKCH